MNSYTETKKICQKHARQFWKNSTVQQPFFLRKPQVNCTVPSLVDEKTKGHLLATLFKANLQSNPCGILTDLPSPPAPLPPQSWQLYPHHSNHQHQAPQLVRWQDHPFDFQQHH